MALLLGQQPVTVLDDGVPDCTLNLGGQSVFAVKAMTFRVVWLCVAGQLIQWVVAIADELGLLWIGHWALRAFKSLGGLSIKGFVGGGN